MFQIKILCQTFANILSHSMAELFTLLTISFTEQKFLVLIVQSKCFFFYGLCFCIISGNSLSYCMRHDLNTILNRSGERRHPCLVFHLRGKTFNLSPLSKVLAVGFGQKKCIKLWKSSPISSVLTVLHFVKWFFCVNIYFFFFSLVIRWITLIVFFFFFWPHHAACGILAPRSGIEPVTPAVEAWSCNRWSAREFPTLIDF